jgi:hypothetical protein
MSPDVLRLSSDVAVCLRSAGAHGFNRERECLKSVSDVDNVFYRLEGNDLKYSRALQEKFGPHARRVEISCHMPQSLIPYSNIKDIVVDPYTFGGVELLHFVKDEAVRMLRPELQVRKREPKKRPPKLYDKIVDIVRDSTPSVADFAARVEEPSLRKWAVEIGRKGGSLEKNYRRFADYLRVGTIRPVGLAPVPAPATVLVSESVASEDTYDDSYYDDYYLSDDADDEMSPLIMELGDDMADWDRASEDGWYYSDDDEDC